MICSCLAGHVHATGKGPSVADVWKRVCASNANSGGFYGAMQGPTILDGETLLRSWWNLEIFDLVAPENNYPPGGSILKTGLVYAEAALPLNSTPTPVSNGDAEWLSLSVCNPRIVQLSRATNVAWQINWGFAQDISAKSMRKNQTGGSMAVYVSWEFALGADAMTGFAINNWGYSVDCLVREAPP